jgi:hypothetical protein
MQPIIFAILPVLVTGLTSLIKRTPIVSDDASQGTRSLIIRSIAAVLSIGGVWSAFALTGVSPDPTVISNDVAILALGFMTFLGSIGGHEVASKK